ncbi:hypothetical protein Zmor_018346 [Zophobas morio]|uniref:Peptidase A2 domain-containing protein n=1 Tax=Zophobas morio TaxID=2755281 RepID=A0AA38MDE2_9CUCU|nr:hypothetical protein Zmor_018346 [Zophobas morio]
MLPHSLVEFLVCVEEIIITQSEAVIITIEIIKDRITEILIGIIVPVVGEILKIIKRGIHKYNSNLDQIILEVVVTTEAQTTEVLTTIKVTIITDITAGMNIITQVITETTIREVILCQIRKPPIQAQIVKIISHRFFVNQATNCKLDDAAVLNVDGLNYVKLIHGENELKFLLDSGASVSVIFPNSKLIECQFIDRNRKIAINGIAGSTISQGACEFKLKVNDIEFNQEFLLIDKFASGIDGIIGSNFFTKHNAIIDYEKYLFSFYVDDWKIAIPIESSYEVYAEIPARCEIIKYCYVKDDDKYVVFPEELCQGVYVAAALTKSRSSKIPVKILNVTEMKT